MWTAAAPAIQLGLPLPIFHWVTQSLHSSVMSVHCLANSAEFSAQRILAVLGLTRKTTDVTQPGTVETRLAEKE